MWTKRQLIQQAFAEIGLGSYSFNLPPERFQSAMSTMDTMMAEWNSLGIRLGYQLASTPTSGDLDQPSGIPDEANSAVYLMLAVRIAPSFGKTVQRETAVSAKMAYSALLSKAQSQEVAQRQFPSTLPVGAGNRFFGRRFFPVPTDPIAAGPDGDIEFN